MIRIHESQLRDLIREFIEDETLDEAGFKNKLMGAALGLGLAGAAMSPKAASAAEPAKTTFSQQQKKFQFGKSKDPKDNDGKFKFGDSKDPRAGDDQSPAEKWKATPYWSYFQQGMQVKLDQSNPTSLPDDVKQTYLKLKASGNAQHGNIHTGNGARMAAAFKAGVLHQIEMSTAGK